MIKKIKIELVIFIVLLINIILSYSADLSIYNYFYNLNYGVEATHLKKFFIKITELGDSLWYFSTFLLILIISFIGKNLKIITVKSYLFLRNFSIFSLFYLLFVGIVTQILKHIIGRPRPNHADFQNNFDFNFFSTDASFHSFPSGHSSTIFTIVIILSLLVPRLKIFFIFFGFIIALSRVVVGAHYVTDIIAGSLLALILYKVVLSIFEKRFPSIVIKDFELSNNTFFFKSNIVFSIFRIFICSCCFKS